MITRKLHIKSIDNLAYIQNKQDNYSYAFRRLYKMLDSATDNNFIIKFKSTFNLNDIEYRSLLSQVKSFKDREITTWKGKRERITILTNRLNNDTDLTKRKKYKLHKTIQHLQNGLYRESTFGGRALQQRLTRECNKQGINRNEDKILQLKSNFKHNRIMPFCIMGESNQKGNRFYDITELVNSGKVIYKPQYGTKINIDVKVPNKYKNELLRLIELTTTKDMAVTIMLSTEYIYLTYDNEYLSGYGIDIKQRNSEVREIKKHGYDKATESSIIKDVYKKYYNNQRDRKLCGKIDDRVFAVDLNPECIGYSILDKVDNGNGVKVVACGLISFKKLMAKTGKRSDSKESKYRNNKHKYEITIAVKYIFSLIKHYRCSRLVNQQEINQ